MKPMLRNALAICVPIVTIAVFQYGTDFPISDGHGGCHWNDTSCSWGLMLTAALVILLTEIALFTGPSRQREK